MEMLAPTALALETVIALEGEGPAKDVLVWGQFKSADVFALGHSGPDKQIKDILYYSAPSQDGGQEDLIPVFTRIEFLQQAVGQNPQWANWEILSVNGGELLDAMDASGIVINPWSRLAYRVPGPMHKLSAAV